MPTAESVISKLQGLIDTANATTGEADTTLTAAIESLIAGFGSGSGANIAQGSFKTGTSGVRTITLNCGFVPSKILITAITGNNTASGAQKLTSTDGGIAALYYCKSDGYPFRVAYYDTSGQISTYNLNRLSSSRDQVSISNSDGVATIKLKTNYSFIFPNGSTFQWVAIE